MKKHVINNLKNEKQIIIIILDNAKLHIAKLVEKRCEILNTKLIPSPHYSPKYNSIKQIWRVIKRKPSIININNKRFLIKKY
ncbi:MAG: transposase [Methanobacteriaceae archaeon]|nr:transposase [Methanobacteriaceae archaeon]